MGKKYVYKNTSKDELVIIGVGSVEAGKTIESEEPLNNPNLAMQKGKRYTGVDPVTDIKNDN